MITSFKKVRQQQFNKFVDDAKDYLVKDHLVMARQCFVWADEALRDLERKEICLILEKNKKPLI